MNPRTLKPFLFGCLALLLAACGAGSGQTAGGGTGGTGISAGSITGFGSIFVNGVEFSTNGATITRDDVPIGESGLRKGMVVEVRGSISSSTSGSASTVTVEEAVRGPVEPAPSGTASAGTLIVLGQTVRVDDTTLFDDNVPNFGSVKAGDLLEVHGHRRADGTVAATFIERKAASVVFVVRGPVANHNDSAQTFTIGALTVNYNGATINDMPAPSGSNWNGRFVEVKGTNCSGNPVCGTLTATKVEPEGLQVNDADQAEVEGFVTAVNAQGFSVGSVPVVTTSATVFEGGTAAEIAVGVKLEVEGTLVGGVLTAEEVEFKDSIRLASVVATVDAGAGTLTLRGLPGVTVNVNQFTAFEGGAGSLRDITVGEHVGIRARATGPSTVIATEVEQRSPDQTAILQGPVQNFVNPRVTILGVNVDTSTVPDQNFRDVNDNPIGATAFFNTLRTGDLVKAKGTLNGSSVTWDEIELED